MSVQQVCSKFSIETICPIIINPYSSTLVGTASTVIVNHNVDAGFSSCNPDMYAYLQVHNSSQAHKCCDSEIKQTVKYRNS